MQGNEWLSQSFDDIYDQAFANVQFRKENDPHFDKHELEELLETQYIFQGQGHNGRGELKELEISATIAAYEEALLEWN
ncbi:MAG: hypothetical protein JXR48_16355 [Candidatus Delongbacteria bacterium]|nr:hypothetical protein [Candidatus Delongbacteria bacterium]MBN2836530.1 hypothetical protein [Candidatus Delongbacteria bacterium]